MRSTLLSASAVLLSMVGIAYAADPPQLKEGLWSIHTQNTSNPGNKKSEATTTICRSHAYDDHVRSLAKDKKGCTTITDTFDGVKRTFNMHCVVGSTVINSKGTSLFQGDTTHSESDSTYTPAMAGISEMIMIQDEKYVGSCPAGAQPGDLTSADGNVVHLGKH